MVMHASSTTVPLTHMGVASERHMTHTVAGATRPDREKIGAAVEHPAEERGRPAHARQLPVGAVENRRSEEQAAPHLQVVRELGDERQRPTKVRPRSRERSPHRAKWEA